MVRDLRVLYLEFGSEHRSQIEEHLHPLLGRLFPGTHPGYVVIDNSSQTKPTEQRETMVIAGDNSNREFSGWQRGIDVLVQQGITDETVLCFSNDTFARNYGTRFLSWFDPFEVNRSLNAGMAVGLQDRRENIVEICGLSFDKWIRSNLFFIRYGELKKVLPLKLPFTKEDVFAKSGSSLFSKNSFISANLVQSLDAWLIGTPQVQGESKQRWYNAAPLTAENREQLQGKAYAILTELYFSARLKDAGIETFDVRRSRTRALGLFALAANLGLLDKVQSFKRKLGR